MSHVEKSGEGDLLPSVSLDGKQKNLCSRMNPEIGGATANGNPSSFLTPSALRRRTDLEGDVSTSPPPCEDP